MANLTITVDDELLKRARIRALERGTSVNRLLADYLEAFAGDRHASSVRQLLDLSQKARTSSGSRGRSWTRDELYDETLGRDR